MANLQINSSPPAIGLIGEGLKYEIERSSPPATGVASLILNFPNDQTAYLDNDFEIETFGGTLKFYFKTTPDESGLQLNTWAVAMPFAAFLAQVVADISLNYLINAYYIVTAEAAGIKLTAREFGSAYDLDFSSSTVTALTEGTNTAGIDDSTASDYAIYVAPLIYSGSTEALLEPLGDDLLPVDDNDCVIADVSEYLKGELSSSFTFPFATDKVKEVPDAVIKYYIRYAEYQDETVQLLYNTFTSPKYAIAGKLAQIDNDLFSDQDTDFFSYTTNEQKFLSWCPLTKITYPSVAERLFFLTQTTGLKLKRKAYYSDGTDVTTTVETISEDAYSIIEILCGVPELFVGEDVSLLTSYIVWIDNSSDEQVSEFRTFVVDNSTFLNIRTIIFKNSFGMYDMLHCTGDLTISDNIKSEEMQVLTDNVFRRIVFLSENTPAYSLNSGWLQNRETRNWLQEVLLSTKLYLALGDYLLPLVKKGGKVTRYKDRDHNYSLQLTFEPDFNSEAFSAIVADGIDYLTDSEFVRFTDDSSIDYFN